jgi:hypothetical protein
VYGPDGRMGAFVIPKSMDAPTLGEVFEKCSKEKIGYLALKMTTLIF